MAGWRCFRSNCSFTSLILALILFTPITNAQDNHFWQKQTTLQGSIKKEIHFGPPNFGETPEEDTITHIFFLQLKEEINIRGQSQVLPFGLSSVPRVQLLGSNISELSCANVSGYLFEGISGHYLSEALMDVSSIQKC